MSHDFDSPVCVSGGQVFNEHLDDADEWHEGSFDIPNPEAPSPDDETDNLCPECYPVIVGGEPETREWLATE